MFSFYKNVVGRACFHSISYGRGENMAMAAADVAMELFGLVDESPSAAAPIPYGIWKMDRSLFSFIYFCGATHVF